MGGWKTWQRAASVLVLSWQGRQAGRQRPHVISWSCLQSGVPSCTRSSSALPAGRRLQRRATPVCDCEGGADGKGARVVRVGERRVVGAARGSPLLALLHPKSTQLGAAAPCCDCASATHQSPAPSTHYERGAGANAEAAVEAGEELAGAQNDDGGDGQCLGGALEALNSRLLHSIPLVLDCTWQMERRRHR